MIKEFKTIYILLILLVLTPMGVFADLIAGDDSLVVRNISFENVAAGDNVQISLNVILDSEFQHNVYLIEEHIPENISIISNGGGELNGQKLLFANVSNTSLNGLEIVYQVRASEIGNYSFDGLYFIDGMDNSATVLGSTELIINDNNGFVVATCSDGIKNQDETGVDCGGVCSSCSTDDSSSSSSSHSSHSSSSGGGYVPPVLVCEESFKCDKWSTCTKGSQHRVCIDVNGCLSNKSETQVCVQGNTEFENALLNVKTLIVDVVDEKTKRYKAKFVGTEESIAFDREVEDYIILVNDETGKEYLSRVIDEVDGKKIYSVEEIDEDVIESGILTEQGLVETGFSTRFVLYMDEVYNSKLTMTIATIMLIFVLICCLFAAHFIIKNTHRKKAYRAILSHENREFLEGRFSDDKINEMGLHLETLKRYVEKNKKKSNSEIRDILISVGWNKEIVDEVLRDRKK